MNLHKEQNPFVKVLMVIKKVKMRADGRKALCATNLVDEVHIHATHS